MSSELFETANGVVDDRGGDNAEPSRDLQTVNTQLERGVYEGDSLLAAAVDRDLDIDKLRALIDMRAAEEARQNRLEYGRHFAEMQAEFGTVRRSKQGYDYRYAPIEVLQKAYAPIISKHGFSYRWREEALPDAGKRVIMTISGWGHEEETSFDIPKLDGTKQMNPVQVAGAMSTYGRRYTFIAGFGVIIEDEDDDAHISGEDAIRCAEALTNIKSASDIDELKARFLAEYKAAEQSGDKAAMHLISKAKDERKAELKV